MGPVLDPTRINEHLGGGGGGGNCSTCLRTTPHLETNTGTHPPFLICPASMGMVVDAPASALSMAYSVSDMVGCGEQWRGRGESGGERFGGKGSYLPMIHGRWTDTI
jgi:hypothetical protein